MKIKVALFLFISVLIVFTGCVRSVTQESALPSLAATDSVQSGEANMPQENMFSKLHVEGAQLMNANDQAVQLRGVSSHNLSQYPAFVNKQAMQQLKDEWDCTVLRLAMYTAEEDGYCTGDEANQQLLKEKIDAAVRDAEELELYVIIDWHILSDGNPLTYKDEAILFFSEMAQKYADEEHVIFEICNEPNGSTTWAEVKTYAQAVIPTIREFSDAVILVGTTSWSKDVDITAMDPLIGFDNIMYTLHFYAASHGQELREKANIALQVGLPIFVSEFGISDASGNGAIDEAEANTWVAFMNENGLSYVMWNLSNKNESSAMIHPDTTKTFDFTQVDLSQTGKWFTTMANKKQGEGMPVPAPSPGKAIIGIEANIVDTWAVHGEQYYKYRVVLRNETSVDISGWKAILEFNQLAVLSETWNANYVLENNMLTITPKAYNQILPASSMATIDVGFIIKSEKALFIQTIIVE